MPRGASVSRTSSAKPTTFVRNVVPDRLDLRDRSYQPAVQVIPKPAMQPIYNLPVLYQGDCNGCTGFSLTTVVHHLESVVGLSNGKGKS